MTRTRKLTCPPWTACLLLAVVVLGVASMESQEQGRVIELLADRDSRYKMAGLSHPAITMKPGEHVVLRITARKAHGANRDGSVHGLALTRAGTGAKVPGWDLLLKPGTQDFALIAPLEPGEYVALCTVICSQDHEGMRLKVFVTE
jgi:hypothetical protein